MTREDFIWVGLRLFGIWLAIIALGNLLEFISSAINLYVWNSLAGSEFADARESAERWLLSAKATGGIALVKLAVYSWASWYLLRRGERLVHWMCPSAGIPKPAA